MPEQTSDLVRSGLERRWVLRMVAIIAVAAAFGAWGLFDATVAYPARGRRYANIVKLDYLKEAERVGQLYSAGTLDPAGDLAKLRAAGVTGRSSAESAKLKWLEALATPGLRMLNPEHARIDDPPAELKRLEQEIATKGQASPLSSYDIPSQWFIMGVCWTLAAWMGALFLSVATRRYAWSPSEKALILPGGERVTPGDLDPQDPVDLRKWAKFIVRLRFKEGGREIRLDTFRHSKLEDWVKELVRAVKPGFEFPDEAKKREQAEREAATKAQDADEQAQNQA